MAEIHTLEIDTDQKHYKALHKSALLPYFFKDGDTASTLLIFLAFVPMCMWFTSKFFEGNVLPFFFWFLLGISLGLYIYILNYIHNFYTWGRILTHFGDEICDVEKFSISYNDNLFFVSKDSEEKILQWARVKEFQMDDEHILIFTDEYIILPKSAIAEKNYYRLARKLEQKVTYNSSKVRV
jgi:hypothetical protein